MRFRPSLLVRFTLLGLLMTLFIAAGFGWLMSRRMVADALDDATMQAAHTVMAVITPQVRPEDFSAPTLATIAAWGRRLSGILRTDDIVRVKVWNVLGQVVYSDDPGLIGRVFPLAGEDELRSALGGHVARDLSSLGKAENANERMYGRLMEIYVPVVLPGSPRVIGAYEVYRPVAPLEARIGAIRRFVWGGSAAAFGLLYAALFVLVSGASRRLLRQEERLRAAFVGTAQALARAVDFKDSPTGDHSLHAAEYAVATAQRLGFQGEAVEDIRMAAYLHDIGKIGVSDVILRKPGPLTPEEWVEMRRHATIGAQILDPVPLAQSIKLAVKHNHERWDGDGYPDRLQGDDIPLAARILIVADAYEAMTTDRPYRRAIGHAAAVAELRRCAGGQFDPQVVDAFLEAIESLRAGEPLRDLDRSQAQAGGF